MKEKQIKVLMVKPGEHPKVVALDNHLKALQAAVSIDAPYIGLLEVISHNDRIAICCNEEGKVLNLPPCRSLGMDILCGTFYVCGQDIDGELTSLTEDEIQHWSEHFWVPEIFSEDAVGNICWCGFEIL